MTQYIQGIKYRWKLPEVEQSKVAEVVSRHNLSFATAHTLLSRGLEKPEDINDFLFTPHEKFVFHPGLFKDSEKAVDRIFQAIEKKEKILIFGDYDVDGITSTSLLLSSLLPLGAKINYFLPNRERDGYGLSKKIVKKAAGSDYSLIITVDNGITAIEASEVAEELGVDLIITDHHRPHGEIPKAVAIINPNQTNCAYPYKSLAGVGVAFKLATLIYEARGLTLPDKVYELLMLGTIADVVPLTGENRFWVRHGLHKVHKQKSYALDVLAKNSKVDGRRLASLDIAFMIAPQLNALGRLDDSRDAVRFLISSSFDDVDRVGKVLKEMNESRKKVERGIYEEIDGTIFRKEIDLDTENIIMAASDKWPAGVIGLVAGKLMHNYGKPAILFHADKKGIVRGSCRSIPEFDIFDALEDNKDLLISFGGHSHAAGLKLKQADVAEFKARLEKRIIDLVATEDLQPKVELDAPLELAEMTKKLLDDLDRMEPFGNKNRQPTFLVKDVVQLHAPKLLKDLHVKISVFSNGVLKPVIFFNRPDLYPIFRELGDKSFDLAGHVMKNEWNGQTRIELQGLDISL
jgi:single-stranded-DNA-specific exonuclease